jgi:histone deacetylase complex regulatory component SIN3
MVGKGQATYLDEVVLKHREDTSIWDLYNDITYHMKPDQIDTVGMIQQNASLASYLTSVIN